MSNEIGWEITMDHLKAYEPRWMDPIRFTYNDHEMLGNPPPQTGGLMMAYILGVLDELDLKSMGHYTESAETLYAIAWMIKRARNELPEVVHDPLSHSNPSKIYLSKEYHRMVAEILNESKPIIDLTEDLQLKTSKAAVVSSGLTPKEREQMDSCQNVVCDPDGNWVSMMHTGNGGGVPGLVVDGVAMGGGSNNGVCIGSGRRHRAGICPVMILDDNGEPMMALGTPGMPVHSTPIVLINIFEFGMEPYEAVDAPRFWPLVQEQEIKKGIKYTVQVENRISKGAVAGLAKLGVQMESLGTYRWNTGSFQIVWKDKKNANLWGTSDPRRLGHAEGF